MGAAPAVKRLIPADSSTGVSARAETRVVAAVVLAAVGATCGVSSLLHGFYDLSAWGWMACAALALAAGVGLAGWLPRSPWAIAALAGLLALWLWSWLSSSWGEDSSQAVIEADRWLLYGAGLLAVVGLMHDEGLARIAMGATTVGLTGVGLNVGIAMATGHGATFFLGNRISDPLGYANGEASYLLLGAWPMIALAERARSAVLAGAGAALATLLLGLAVLSESRGVALAAIGSAVLVVAVLPGRRTRLWAILLVAAGVAASVPALLDVYRETTGSAPPAQAVVAHATRVLLAASLVVGVVWAAARALAATVEHRYPQRRNSLRGASTATLVAIAFAGAGGVVVAEGNPVTALRTQVHAFTHLQGADTGSRLLSGAGNRYDYWRVAWRGFAAHPVRGVGAGNYPALYFAQRQTTEDIRQPHSVELQTLVELGLVGALSLTVFLVGVGGGLVRRVRPAPPEQIGLTVAAAGMFAAWLLQTSVDWLHLIPGLTGVALIAAAVLVRSDQVAPPSEPRAATHRRAWSLTGAVAVLAVAAVGAYVVIRPTLALHERTVASRAVSSDPRSALTHAGASLALDGRAVSTWYVVSAAYARVDRFVPARAALLRALELEPHDFVTWALLGDLESRRGHLAAASQAYRQAAVLNPRDPQIAALALNPRGAPPPS